MNKMQQCTLYLALAIFCAAGFVSFAEADNFGKVYFDQKNSQLIVTMNYRGTNPNHNFSLKWGACNTDSSGVLSVTAEILDDQFNDVAQTSFKKTSRFGLSDLPCSRPVSVTLRSAPRFLYTLTIPG